MAKKKSQRLRTRIEQNTFIRGLITEANPLTYPENASLDEENFILHKDGSRQRRLGLQPEIGAGNTTVPFVEEASSDIEHFLWKNAGGNQAIDISVLRVGSSFYFFDNNAVSVSNSPLNGGNPETVIGFDPTGAGGTAIYDYAFINGRMFVVSGFALVWVLTYNEGTDTVTSESKEVSIRDTFGIFESTDVDYRAPWNTVWVTGFNINAHIYNLINQGWLDNHKLTDGSSIFKDFDSIAATAREGSIFPLGIGKYPSNADRIGLNLVSSTSVPSALGLYNPDELESQTYGTQSAPKGHIIINNMFTRGYDRQIATEGRSGRDTFGDLPSSFNTVVSEATLDIEHEVESTTGGFNSIISYAGRVFYTVYESGTINADDNSPSFGDTLFFSQSTDGIDGLTRCYSELDPTSVEEFASLDTDGGYVTLSGIGSIRKLEVLGNSLFVFADNGVWQVNGGRSLFSATNINVTKVTTIGSIGVKNLVVAEDKIFYLSTAGFYSVILSKEDPANAASAIPISQDTIQQFVDSVSSSNQENMVGYYDPFSRQIKWLMSRESKPNKNYYDTELVLDLNLNAFYVSSFKDVDSSGNTPYVIGYLERPTSIKVETANIVTVGGDPVEVLLDPVIVTFRSIDNNLPTSNKYWMGTKLNDTELEVSIAEYRDLLFRDWSHITNTLGGQGEDAEAFLLTGYLTGGDSSTNKRVTYLTTHFRRTERIFTPTVDGFEPDNPSSCILTGQWGWTSSINSGRWTNPQQIYRLPRTFIPDVGDFDYGHEVVTTKNKLRGKGKALSLLFKSEPLKDCHIYGWSYEINSEVSV